MISHQSRGKGPKSCLTFIFNYMRVKWLAVIVLTLGLLLWLWIDFMVLAPGRCFGHGIQPTPLAEWNEIPITVCSIAIVVVVWPAVGLCFQAKTFFSM